MTLRKRSDPEAWPNKKAAIRERIEAFQQKLDAELEERWGQFVWELSQELGVTEYTIRKQMDD